MSTRPKKIPPGEVRNSIYRALDDGAAHPVASILDFVKDDLGRSVAPSSVRSYLRLNVGEEFEKTGRGYYRRKIRKLRGVGENPQATFKLPAKHLKTAPYELIREDCLDWLQRQPADSFEAVVTDPPYGLKEYCGSELTKLREGRGGVWRIPPSFDGHKRSPLPRFTVLQAEELVELEHFFANWAKLILRVVVPGGNVIVASNPLVSDRLSRALSSAGLERRGEIVRLVMTMRGGDRPKNAHNEFPDVSVMPRSMWEPWLAFRKPIEGRVQDNLRKWKTGGFRRISDEQPFGDVIASHPTRPKERELAPHPSLKPQAFMRRLVRAVLPLGVGRILDPFAGSGATIAACSALGYGSVGVEIDPTYFRLATEAIPKLVAFSPQ